MNEPRVGLDVDSSKQIGRAAFTIISVCLKCASRDVSDTELGYIGGHDSADQLIVTSY